MDKDTKIILSAFVILLISFVVFNSGITGNLSWGRIPIPSPWKLFRQRQEPVPVSPIISEELEDTVRRVATTPPTGVAPRELLPCSDSDGLNLGVKGRVNGIPFGRTSTSRVTRYDTCTSDGKLTEWSCDEDRVVSTIYPCPIGYKCDDGACVPGNECVAAGYKCTSAVRGCGHYQEFSYSCDNPVALVCCEEIPYCGDGVCFYHPFPSYGENITSCLEDCI